MFWPRVRGRFDTDLRLIRRLISRSSAGLLQGIMRLPERMWRVLPSDSPNLPAAFVSIDIAGAARGAGTLLAG